MVEGYKSFDKDFKNRSGIMMEEGKIYSTKGKIIYGNNGFHLAKRLEDTLRYQLDDDQLIRPKIAKVIGFGNIVENSDEYYGYYDLYSVQYLFIQKFLSPNEIINHIIKLNENSIIRFISMYKLTDEELESFINRSINIDLAILYYQKNNKMAYQDFYDKNKTKLMKK